MTKIECPRCKQETITLKQKLLTNKWVDAFCPNCNAKLCAQPVLLALMSFVLIWSIILFGYLTIKEASLTFAVIFIASWALIEFFMYYIPLCALKSRKKTEPPASD